MPDSAFTQALTLVVFAIGGLAVYGSQLRHVVREGGKVRVGALGFPELLISLVFAGLFALLTASAAMAHYDHPAPEVKIDSVLPNSLLFIIFTVGIAGFIRLRGLPLRHTFGFDQISLLPALGWAVALILATLPIAAAVNALTVIALHGKVEPQPLVDLFIKVARQHDIKAMSKILISAVFIQPVCEEFLFRGFFYGVWKRYLGGIPAVLVASTLFAGFHGSLTALAGLFVLAICLNIAYERTGSLLVPTVMHALFNFTSLLFIYAQAQSSGAH